MLLKILPPFFISLYRNYKRNRKAKKRALLEKSNQVVKKADIEQILIACGIKEGDTIMLHSSLGAMGMVEGGAKSVIDAFMNVIGENGTLAMPAFPAIGFNYDYLSGNPVFDVRNTPSKMGIITETFRKVPGVNRSLHPTDSVCALGKHAIELTQSHFGQLTPYNAQSPFYKLCSLGGKIIMLGVDLNSLTNLHTLEDAVESFKYPVYHSKTFDCTLINERGERVAMRTKCHDPKWSKKRKCNDLTPLFTRAGFLKETRIGEARVLIIKAKEMHDWMVKNYIENGVTMYTPNGNSN